MMVHFMSDKSALKTRSVGLGFIIGKARCATADILTKIGMFLK